MGRPCTVSGLPTSLEDTAAVDEDPETTTDSSPGSNAHSQALLSSPLTIVGGTASDNAPENIGDTDSDRSGDGLQPPRTRRKLDSDQSPATDVGIQPIPSSGRVPAELYLDIFELVLAPLGRKSFEYNVQVVKLRQVCRNWRRLIDQTTKFWLRITSRCPIKFNKEVIKNSGRDRHRGPPFSIEVSAGPSDSKATSAKILRGVSGFMNLLNPYKDQWSSLDVVLPKGGWERLEPHLKTQAATLKRLTISLVTNYDQPAGLGNDHDYREISLLGGNGAELKHLTLHNIPIHFNPTALPGLLKLELSEPTRIARHQLMTFLINASGLETLDLTNVSTSDGPFESSWENDIALPSLRRLTLREISNPINMFSLFLALNTPNCRHLSLGLALEEDMLPDDLDASMDSLEMRLGTITRLATALESETVCHIRLGEDREDHEWWQEGIDKQGQPVGIRVFLRYAEEEDINPENDDMRTIFCRLVTKVLNRTGRIIPTKTDVSHSLSGVGSIIQSHALEGLNLFELSADVIDGYLGRLSNFLTRNDSSPKFPSLRTLHLLSAEPKHNAEKVAGSLLSLEDLIEQLLMHSYGGMDESSLHITLRGQFTMSDKLWQVLKNKAHFKGISMDYSRAIIWAEDCSILFLKEGSVVGVQETGSGIDRPW